MFTITLCRLCMILYHNLLYVCIVNTHACFLFSLCFLCALSSVSQYWCSDIAVDKKHFELFRKKLVLLCWSTALLPREKVKALDPSIQSYPIIFFLSSALPPTLFKSPQTHTHTHTHQRYGHQDFQVRKQTSQGQGRNPFSGETEKYFLMILGFTPILTESLQMPMVCPGESCSTHVLIVLVGGLLRPHGWQCLLLVFSPHWYAR